MGEMGGLEDFLPSGGVSGPRRRTRLRRTCAQGNNYVLNVDIFRPLAGRREIEIRWKESLLEGIYLSNRLIEFCSSLV